MLWHRCRHVRHPRKTAIPITLHPACRWALAARCRQSRFLTAGEHRQIRPAMAQRRTPLRLPAPRGAGERRRRREPFTRARRAIAARPRRTARRRAGPLAAADSRKRDRTAGGESIRRSAHEIDDRSVTDATGIADSRCARRKPLKFFVNGGACIRDFQSLVFDTQRAAAYSVDRTLHTDIGQGPCRKQTSEAQDGNAIERIGVGLARSLAGPCIDEDALRTGHSSGAARTARTDRLRHRPTDACAASAMATIAFPVRRPHRNRRTTSIPQSTGLACTWGTE